jgi:hypothetical protein
MKSIILASMLVFLIAIPFHIVGFTETIKVLVTQGLVAALYVIILAAFEDKKEL